MLLLIAAPGSFYSFKVESIDGGKINFADYKGKKILIVNTASHAVILRNMLTWKSCTKNTRVNW